MNSKIMARADSALGHVQEMTRSHDGGLLVKSNAINIIENGEIEDWI